MAQLYSISDTCRILNISRTTVYKLIAQKKLLIVKIGRSTRVKSRSINDITDGEAA